MRRLILLIAAIPSFALAGSPSKTEHISRYHQLKENAIRYQLSQDFHFDAYAPGVDVALVGNSHWTASKNDGSPLARLSLQGTILDHTSGFRVTVDNR